MCCTVITKFRVEKPVFTQDNVPWHKAKYVSAHLYDEGINVMDWTSQSPYVAFIKYLWETLGQNDMAKNPSNV